MAPDEPVPGPQAPDLEQRVLILAPTGKDAVLAQSILARAGVDCTRCPDFESVREELNKGAGALLVAEEAIDRGQQGGLVEWLAAQPPWSDLPVLLLSRSGADSSVVALAMDVLGNVVLMERPTRVAALVSAVRTALRARQRQYQIRDQLVERERSFAAQALLAAIVAQSDDAIISKTLDGNILTWNAGAERVFGYTAAEAIGRSIMMLIPSERSDEEAELLKRLRAGERIEHFETVRVAKDGRRVDISLTVSPVRDAEGKIIAASKVARDISEGKRAAETLRAVQDQLLTVTDNMAVAVAQCSRDFRYLWVSPGFAGWLGRSASDVIGRPIPEIIGASAFETIFPHVTRVLEGERVEFEMQVPYQGLGMRWVKAAYVPTSDRSGRTDGWVAVIVDTTDHHRLEDALRDADRRKDEFLAMLAHELRNPLAPIRNSLHILRLSTRQEPTLDYLGGMMERQVDHMVRLVDDLMEVSRITRGKIELRKELVEVAPMVRSAVETSRPLIETAHHQLVLDIPQEPLFVEADPVRLTQIFANLLNNAAKYTDEGGHISIKVRREDATVAVSVLDNGSGISGEMLPHVFELFAQANRSITKAQGGLGIGLTLVKRLVEMHGGTVSARSAGPGQGSEFVVRLPLATARQAAEAPGAASQRSSGLTPRRILVVDDNRDAAESLGMLLEMLGADVHVVHSGQEALKALETYRPTVVLLDIGMPDMDGHEVARQLRQRPEGRDVTLIALTGWGQEEDRRRSKVAGFDYHLIKPADVRSLESLLVSLDRRTGNGKG